MLKLLERIPPKYRLIAGWGLVILGAVFGPVPVIQGWILGIPGLIILAEHYHWARRILVWAKKKAGWKEDQTRGEHSHRNQGRGEAAGDQ